MGRSTVVTFDRLGGGTPRPPEVAAEYRFAGWRLDLLRRTVRRPDGRCIDLSASDFTLLCAFVERPQRLLDRDLLLDLIGGRQKGVEDRAVDVQVSRLRRRLAEDDWTGPELIRTLRGRGYMFTFEVEFIGGFGRA